MDQSEYRNRLRRDVAPLVVDASFEPGQPRRVNVHKQRWDPIEGMLDPVEPVHTASASLNPNDEL